MESHPGKNYLILTRVSSFLAVLLLFVNYYLLLILNNFYSLTIFDTDTRGFIAIISLFSFFGVALGALLCSFFMPLFSYRGIEPVETPPRIPVKTILFILVIIIPNVILRSLGVELWASSLFTRFFVHVLSGMLYPICLGLFLQTHLVGNNLGNNNKVLQGENRTSRYGIFYFAIAVIIGIVIRYIYLSILENFGLTSNTIQVMNLTYNIINIFMLLIGFFIFACIFLLVRFNLSGQKQDIPVTENSLSDTSKTNWQLIFRLIGLAVVFRVLNSAMELRLFPRLTYSMNSFDLHPVILIIFIPLFALIAGRSINRFLKIFIPAAISIFILIPCLLFFNEYPGFLLFMEILVGLLNNLIWVVFTFAIIEHYNGRFWFYALASSIHFTTLFSMLSPIISRFIPDGTEFTILICGIAALLFLFLAIRIVFPKTQPVTIVKPDTSHSDNNIALLDIFQEYKLSDGEIEVAVLVMEGLKNEEIAKKLYRATITIKVHLVSIYRKLNVRNRAEFMLLVMKRLQG
ncbi:MAG: LuxR C-terminal-related transcriptional regulator [Treponema sp.]|nr:LuxR C-terminal-related transcriptional regulator [Treponema sp.]